MVYANSFQFKNLRKLRLYLYREANIAKSKNILDIGCGDGLITREIYENSRSAVFGMDINPRKIPNKGICLIKGNCEDIPFKDKSLDVVTSSFVFLWLKNLKKSIKEIRRVLKDDGKLVILSEPSLIERQEFPDIGFSKLLIDSLRELGANLNLEKDIIYQLKENHFKVGIKKTEKSIKIEQKEEIVEEIEFLFEKKFIDDKVKKKMVEKIFECKSFTVKLPILYGICLI